jgi:phosphatidylinositol alpha-1,6-mannosyltransferase
MKICLVSKTADPKTGGLGRHVLELANSLEHIGHEVTVLTREGGSSQGVKAEVVEVGYVDLRQDVLNSYSAMPGFVNYLRRNGEEFDIVHGHGLLGSSQVFSRFLGFNDTSFVYTLHGVSSEHTSRKWLEPVAKMLFLPEKFTVNRADRLIAVSKDAKERAIEHYGIDEGKLEVVYNGVDIERFRSVSDFEDKILFVGHMASRKGPQILLESFDLISDDYPELELVMVGGGRMKPELQERAVEKGLENRVQFLEGIDEDKLVRLYSESIFVLPSSYEGLGMVYVEAMSCGSPVIGCDNSAVPEVIADGETGFLAERDAGSIADKLRRILEDPELREKMGKKGREKAETWSWNRIAEDTEAVYEKVLD